VIKAPYAVNFSVDLFNVFNAKDAVEIDENYTYDSIAPITNFNCTNKNSAQAGNPITAVQADCPALNYLKTVDGRPVTVNPNWGKAALTTTAYQIPLAMRLGLSLTF
jgi:hypothetical protein